MKVAAQTIFVFFLATTLAACAALREPAVDPEPEPVVEHINMADHEEFDATPFREEVPSAARIEHDVPQPLMDGDPPPTTTVTLQGFRIQIFSATDKALADRSVEDAMAWWTSVRHNAPPGLFSAQLPVHVIYQQPYYRVRIGDFETRAQAERALDFLREQYPGAFLAPDTVTITR
jgi:hypothetical protein